MADKLVKLSYELGFVVPDVEDEGDDFDPVEYFLDCVHEWVMNTHPDDVRDNITVEDY